MNNPKEYYSLVTNIDIGDVARELVGGRITDESGGVIYVDCPRHDSVSRRSFTIDTKKQLWRCYGCCVNGDVLQLVEFIQSGAVTKNGSGTMPDTHRAARDWLAKKAGMPPLSQWNLSPEQVKEVEARRSEEELVFGILEDIADFYHVKFLARKDALEAFAAQYGISADTIKSLKIGFSDNDGLLAHLKEKKHTPADIAKTGCFNYDFQENLLPVFKNRYVFPYWKQGRVVYLIARQSPWTEKNEYERAKYKKLQLPNEQRRHIASCVNNRYFFNEDALLAKSDFVVITEGVTDCVSLMERGFTAFSPVTNKFSDSDLDKLFNLTRKFERIYICQDNEPSEAGFKGAMKTAHYLESRGLKVYVSSLPLEEKHKEARARMAALPPDAPKKTIDELRPACKIDVNEYFLAHTADDFRALLRKAMTPIQYAINAIPPDAPESERNSALEPILRRMARRTTLEQDTHLEAIREHFTTKISKTALRTTMRQLKEKGAPGGEHDEPDEPTLRELAEDVINHAGPFCYASNTGWFKYREGVWKLMEKDNVNQIIDMRLDQNYRKDNTTKRLRDEVREKTALHSQVLLPVESILNGSLHLLNLQNGMYDIRTGKMLPHDPKYLSTIQLPYPFDPRAKCPRWMRFLDEALPDDLDSQRILQEWFGYCLVPDTKFEKALFCVGEGCNGKTVALTVLENLVGKDNCSHISLDKLDADFHTVGLFNKLLNLCKETEAREVANSAAFKSIVSGETQEDAFKFRDRFSFPVYARLCFATNNFPKFNDTSQGVFRRLLILNFKQSFEGREDTGLIDNLLEELPAIFQWALAGYKRLQARGRFQIPLDMLEAIEDLKRHSSSVASFVSECVERVEAGGDGETPYEMNHRIYEAYKEYCRENNFRAFASVTFFKELRRALTDFQSEYRWNNGKSVRVILGIKLK